MIKRHSLLFNNCRDVKYDTMYKSYRNWALMEMGLHLRKRRNDIESVESFRKKLDDFACSAKTDQGKIMFSVAYDVVTEHLDNLIEKGGI